MNKPNDGGPAFPVPIDRAANGLSLRDYFAAKAMQGIMVNATGNGIPQAIAEWAYEVADAMIKQGDQIT